MQEAGRLSKLKKPEDFTQLLLYEDNVADAQKMRHRGFKIDLEEI